MITVIIIPSPEGCSASPVSAGPDQGYDPYQPGDLIHPEFHEPGVTELGHPLLRVICPHGPAEQPVIRVLADAGQGPDQDIQRPCSRPPIWRSARSSSQGR